MIEKLEIPKFESEAEEAEWWDRHREETAKWLEEAVAAGKTTTLSAVLKRARERGWVTSISCGPGNAVPSAAGSAASTHQSSPQIRFQSYNPYESLYPGLRVVSRDTLHLIKTLRTEGYPVVVEPDDGRKLSYFVQKGIREILSDPIWLFVINIEVSILANLLSSWLYDRLKRPPEPEEVRIILECGEQANRARYSQSGRRISDEQCKSFLAALDRTRRQFEDARKLVPPDPDYFLPIFLEHTGKVVGWSKGLIFDDVGKRMGLDTVRIFDGETLMRIQSGELKGWSHAGIVSNATCLICGAEYVECNHIAGLNYDGRECQLRYTLLPAEISIVKDPVQPIASVEKVWARNLDQNVPGCRKA